VTSLLRPRDVARILLVSEMTVRNLAAAGAIKSVCFKSRGNRWTIRFRPQDIEEFLTGNLRSGKAVG
jgi:hypothetical protein